LFRLLPRAQLQYEHAATGVPAVLAGTLDRSEELDCDARIFTAYRQQWISFQGTYRAGWRSHLLADFMWALAT
jgi:hypothetical protein